MVTNGRTRTPSADARAATSGNSRTTHSRGEIDDAPEATEESSVPKASVCLALKELGAAAKGVILALARSALALWRAIHWLIRELLIWVGIPVAIGIFGISVSYYLLSFYLRAQAEVTRQLKAELTEMREERQALEEKLESALAGADKAKDETKKASVAPDAATKQPAPAKDAPPLGRNQVTIDGGTDLTGKPTTKGVAMPCDLDGPATGYGARLSQCLKEYEKLNGS